MARATIADARVYTRVLTANEREAIRLGQGRDGITEGLLSRLMLWDSNPGDDTDTTTPTDAANPARSWTVTGTGDAYTWAEAPYPLRRL